MRQHYDGTPDISKMGTLIKEKEEQIEILKKQKKVILEEEKSKNKKAHDLSVKLQKLREERNKVEAQIIETKLELNKCCTHEKLRTEEKSYPGGYLDRSEYRVSGYCKLCGVLVDEKVTHGNFG